MKHTITAAALASLTLLTGVSVAQAQPYRHHHQERHYRQTYYRSSACEGYRRHNANRGTVTGAVAGGLLGNVMAGRGSRTEGTLIGAGVGAVAGHELSSRNARRHCR